MARTTVIENVTILKKTDKALLCEIDDQQVWIPISQLHEDSTLNGESDEGELGDIVIPEWLAEEKDLL